VLRKYVGDKKSLEARSDDKGRTWNVQLFDRGRLTTYRDASLPEVDALASKNGLRLTTA
jgi:hypothetical protein